MTRFQDSLGRSPTTMTNVHGYQSSAVELYQANTIGQAVRPAIQPPREFFKAPASRKTQANDSGMDHILNAREGLEARPKGMLVAPNEGAQISKLFKRVRVFVKENPLPFSDKSGDGSGVDRKDSLTIADPLLLVRKRRSSDMDALADKFNDKCRCVEDE